MSDYISREATVTIADYAADGHPFDKNPKQPETYSEYNRGWNDACDYIRDKLDDEKSADVEPVRHGRWVYKPSTTTTLSTTNCSVCGWWTQDFAVVGTYCFCPSCGAKMDLADETNDD